MARTSKNGLNESSFRVKFLPANKLLFISVPRLGRWGGVLVILLYILFRICKQITCRKLWEESLSRMTLLGDLRLENIVTWVTIDHILPTSDFLFPNLFLVKLNKIWIITILFRLIWLQTEYCMPPNQSEKCRKEFYLDCFLL